MGRASPNPVHLCGPCRGPTGQKLRPAPSPLSGRASRPILFRIRPCFRVLFSGRARADPKSPVHIPSTSHAACGIGLCRELLFGVQGLTTFILLMNWIRQMTRLLYCLCSRMHCQVANKSSRCSFIKISHGMLVPLRLRLGHINRKRYSQIKVNLV